ncbi:hypothetical protein Tco_1263328 [Tanacetum coccineum]
MRRVLGMGLGHRDGSLGQGDKENRKYATKGRYGKYHNQPMAGFLRLKHSNIGDLKTEGQKQGDRSAAWKIEAVMNYDKERLQLEAEVEHLAGQDDGGGKALDRIYQCLDDMDASTAENLAAKILNGYGFNKLMQAKNTTHFSKHVYYFGMCSVYEPNHLAAR